MSSSLQLSRDNIYVRQLSKPIMTLLYEQNLDGGQEQNDSRTTFAQEFTTNYSLDGITKVTIYLKRLNAPAGTVKACLWAGSALPESPTEESDETYTNDQLTTSFSAYDFTFSGSTDLTSPFKIGVVFSTTGSSSQYAAFSLSTVELDDRSWKRNSGNSWIAGYITSFQMLVYGSSGAITVQLLPPPVAWI